MKSALMTGFWLGMGLLAAPVRAEPVSPPASIVHGGLLVVGDSHSEGLFGKALTRSLRTRLVMPIRLYGSCGSSPSSWYSGWTTTCGYREESEKGLSKGRMSAPTPLVEDLLAKFKPQVVVIELGSNFLVRTAEIRLTTTRQMIRSVRAAGAQCIWVGPPAMRYFKPAQIESFYRELKEIVREPGLGCEVVDSRPHSPYGETGGDGLHYDARFPKGDLIAESWAQAVAVRVTAAVRAARK